MKKKLILKKLPIVLLLILTLASICVILSPSPAVRRETDFSIAALPSQQPGTVWVSSKGGTKYHLRRDCSGMSEAIELPLDDAVSQGFSPCKKCG